jgi:DNA-binding XRE family transcriptional regulator
MNEQRNRVRELREAAALTQADLAHQAEVTVGTISAIERGETVPKITTALAIARALGVDVGALFLTAGSNGSVENSDHTLGKPDASAGRTAPLAPSVAVEGDQAVGNPDADGERVR